MLNIVGVLTTPKKRIGLNALVEVKLSGLPRRCCIKRVSSMMPNILRRTSAERASMHYSAFTGIHASDTWILAIIPAFNEADLAFDPTFCNSPSVLFKSN